MKLIVPATIAVVFTVNATIALAHSSTSRFPTYTGLVMCGYQGWFRAPTDGSHQGWGHYAAHGKVDADHLHVHFWPDTAEYAQTYPTELKAHPMSKASWAEPER